MANVKKIELKNVILKQSDKNILTIEGFEGEETPFENLSEKITEFIQLGKPLNIKIAKARKAGGGVVRKPTYKYVCPNCAKEVKANIENMTIKCVECDTDFIQA